jgi:hypothetical protein
VVEETPFKLFSLIIPIHTLKQNRYYATMSKIHQDTYLENPDEWDDTY